MPEAAADDWAEAAVTAMIESEFSVWANALPRHTEDTNTGVRSPYVRAAAGVAAVFPHPAAEGGLPEGWQVHWRTSSTTASPYGGTVTTEVFLIERGGTGGWGVVYHSDVEQRVTASRISLWAHTSPTVTGLYETAALLAETDPETVRVERFVGEYIRSCYDLADPAEAAEATLVGLGACITVFPRALIKP